MTTTLRCRHLPSWLVLPMSYYQSRPYAISRFPKRVSGTGRTRQKISVRSSISADTRASGDDQLSAHQPLTFNFNTTTPTHPDGAGLTKLLMHRDTLVIERQLEMLNVFIGFEQANKYTISDVDGEPLGYIAEEPRGFWGTISRQAFSTHRPFRAVILDKDGIPVLWESPVRRPFAWINSRMFVQRLKDHSYSPYEPDPALETVGEVQQIWHLWRRRYDLFLREELPLTTPSLGNIEKPDNKLPFYYQIAKVDSGLFAWDFSVLNEQGVEIATVERAFRGIGREIFTDTGKYSVHFKDSGVQNSLPNVPEISNRDIARTVSNELNIDARSVLLALAVNIDFDYFSRHSHTGGGGLFHLTTWE